MHEVCQHTTIECLNPFELIRKYRCLSCRGVMMCACEEEIGRRFLPHQLAVGSESKTSRRIPVTLGFVPATCNPCRGMSENSHPKSGKWGGRSKVRRYYWREIALQTMQRFGEWARTHGHNDWIRARAAHPDAYATIRREIIKEITERHQLTPKYNFAERSQSHFLHELGVEVVRLDATYSDGAGQRAAVVDRHGGGLVGVEEYVANHYRLQGHNVLFLESRPLHVLFATFAWLVIQDHADPRVRMVGVGGHVQGEAGRPEPIWFPHPEDFGTAGYALRRADAIEQHFAQLPGTTAEMLWLFEYWLEPSVSLRRYLHALDADDVRRAREVVQILPPATIHGILRFLVGSYWERYCGWPDLLVHGNGTFCLVEVKSSRDELSSDQKDWIKENAGTLKLPFKLVKVYRRVVPHNVGQD